MRDILRAAVPEPGPGESRGRTTRIQTLAGQKAAEQIRQAPFTFGTVNGLKPICQVDVYAVQLVRQHSCIGGAQSEEFGALDRDRKGPGWGTVLERKANMCILQRTCEREEMVRQRRHFVRAAVLVLVVCGAAARRMS